MEYGTICPALKKEVLNFERDCMLPNYLMR